MGRSPSAEHLTTDERQAGPPGRGPRRTLALALALAAGLALVALATALTRTIGGGAYVLVYLSAALPGLPVGRRLFGRHPLGILAGAAIGYGLSCLTVWAVIKSGHPGGAAFSGAWLVLSGVAWLVFRRPHAAPLIVLPPWGWRDTAALAVVLALVATLIAIPYRTIGTTDEDGNRLYRAYFTADFWWHMSLTAELARFEMPPVNPYLAPERMNYYWTYFMVPAATAGSLPARANVIPETLLKVNALCTALLFTSLIFSLAWCGVRRRWPLLAGVSLALFAHSAEGAYMLWRVQRRGEALSALRDINIDSVTAWVFQGLRIDSLLRAMWYNPQHSTSITLALVALLVAAAAGSSARLGAVALAGLALGLSTTFNPFLGAVFSAIYGLVVAADTLRTPREAPRRLLRQAIAVVPVVAALAWCVLNEMVEGAGGALHVGLHGLAWKAPFANLFLSLGPVVVPVVGALWPSPALVRAYWPSLAGVGAALGVMYLLQLTVEPYWMGFRSGQIFLATAPALIARFFAQVSDIRHVGRPLAVAAFALLALVGLPTTVIDVFNGQDVANRAMGPGFRWTIPISGDQQAAMEWIRRMTPREAVVQLEPVGRGRDTWSLIASLGQRRMAAGVPLPLMATPEYDRRMSEVQTIYSTPDAASGWRTARRLGIDYLYLDDTERAAYAGPGFDKFKESPEYFVPVFRKGAARVYAVAR